MSKPRPERLLQTIVEGSDLVLHRPISTLIISETELRNNIGALQVFDHAEPLGIAPGFNSDGYLVSLAISDNKECRIIEFQLNRPKHGQKQVNKKAPSQEVLEGRQLLQDKVLCRETGDLFAFDFGPLSMALHKNLEIRVINAIDIQSNFSVGRKPISAIEAALGDSVKINQENVVNLFNQIVYNREDRHSKSDLFMRAWISQFLVSFRNGMMLFENAKRIDTRKLSSQHLNMIGKVANDSTRLDHKKPMHQVITVSQIAAPQAGNDRKSNAESVGVKFENFATRLRSSDSKTVQLAVNTPLGPIVTGGVVGRVHGRVGQINSTNDVQLASTDVVTITSIGRDDPTSAEAKRAAIILRFLQGDVELLDNPWIRNIWFSAEDDTALKWPKEWSLSTVRPPVNASFTSTRILNPSQQTAVNAMLSQHDDHRITIVQGPPGTGKTSVISSYVQYSVKSFNRTGIWLVAQSNVAIKNVAEKLIKDKFMDWKLLVSKEFIYDWHDHLYEEIRPHIIQSIEFKKWNPSKLRNISVILSTLSMLSNTSITTFTKCVPIHTLVVDEASQIEIGDYIPAFSSFKHSLQKICFVGDDKQLPPFGQEDLQDLQSIFEVIHLRSHILFLDMQYRMPPQIGDIISKAVYDGQLHSNPDHPITNKTTACHFFNISDGKEKQSNNKSFMNELECQAILKLVRRLQENGKSLRIITPYEAQRNHIELSLKAAELEWGDTCFNVDSFQGNEDDYIILSVVRTRDIGFLKSLRRTNVMLSRCKKGMFIFSNKQFLTGPGAETLVGTFMAAMGGVWLTETDIDTADLF